MSTMVVIAANLNLRDAPTVGGRVIAVLARGTKVRVLEWTPAWSRVDVFVRAPSVGWVSSHYLAPDALAAFPRILPPTFPWCAIAEGELGVGEAPGPANNPRILEYAATTTLQAKADTVPWCSAFVNWCVTQAGLVGTKSAAARSWLEWGAATSPTPGCIVVLARGAPPSAHVAFLVDVEGGLVHLLGGNQADTVRVSAFATTRVLGYRGPLPG